MSTSFAVIEEQAVDNAWGRKNIEQYLESDGAEVDHPMADHLILLYTKGRKSGKIRRVPVASYRDGDDLIVIGSKGGAPEHPAWFLNLRDDPQVWVRQKSEGFEAEATVLEGDEHAAMWERVTEWAPGFQRYQERTERQIPLVRLRLAEPLVMGGSDGGVTATFPGTSSGDATSNRQMTRKGLTMRQITATKVGTLLLLLLGLMTLGGVSVLGADNAFTDDDHSVFESDIDDLAAIGVTIGCNPPDNDRYCPGRFFTRAQAAAFVRRALDIEWTERDFFFDDEQSVFENDINAIAAAGITQGCNPPHNWYFCPDKPITRAEMTAFLRRALIATTAAGEDDFNLSVEVFTDTKGSVFERDINALGNARIALSCGDPLTPAVQQHNPEFCPDDLMTRGQAAGFMRRALTH